MTEPPTLPLRGVKVIEMAAIGPVPFCGMTLADMGAEVIRVDRTFSSELGVGVDTRFDFMARGKASIALDVKHPEGLSALKKLISGADILIEGFRPGVMERLGVGPEDCLRGNPRLIFGRCSGWGDKGPLAPRAGHDINFLSVAGVLAAMGPRGEPPVPPLNLVGDFGGGAMHLVAGVLAALLFAKATGRGQVVSASIADGALGLMAMIYGWRAGGVWSAPRGENILDGGAPYYRTYLTRDKRYVAVGAIERKFFAELLAKLGLSGEIDVDHQNDRVRWPRMVALLEQRFSTRTRDEWSAVFRDSDACVTPVLELDEVPKHPQQVATQAFVDVEGASHTAPVVKFSQSPGVAPRVARRPGADTRYILSGLGYADNVIERLINDGAVA